VRLYHRGDRGEPVRDIQGRLSALGIDLDPDRRGTFGPGTDAAVRGFQRMRGLPEDGIVGPETWRTLVDAGYGLGDRMLYRRVPMMRGDDVATLQKRLNALGFDSGKVDGIFGADTLTALLDFQRNRGMPEDGIAGHEITDELVLMARATDKPGREQVREREWLSSLPSTLAGQRFYLDPACPDEATADTTWPVVLATVAALRSEGAQAIISRSVDTAPPERLRARRANRLDVQLVIAFTVPPDGVEGVFYFASEHSSSAAGETIATAVADRLGLAPLGRATPMLKETRPPAVVVATRTLSAETGIATVAALVELYRSATESADQPKNVR
jgi:peptidoglycan hydrolase-like protein with peptidoglycan-binding domain